MNDGDGMDIQNELIKIIKNNISVIYDDIEITLDMNFFDDLGVDSITLMQLILDIEERFNILFEEESISTLFGSIKDLLLYIEKRINNNEHE